MPNRILKESICTSDSINELDWFGEVLFYRLMVNCDDFGRYDGRVSVIKNRLFPLKEGLTAKNVENAINKLVSVGLVCRYEANGKPFLFLPTWNEHQQIRAKKSKFPEPEVICNQLISDDSKCPRNPIQSNPNPNTNARTKKGFAPPTLKEVEDYCQQRGNKVDAKRFFDFFEASGWIDSKGKPVQSWKQKVITWEGYSPQGETTKGKNFTVSNDPNKFEKIDMDELQRLVDDI